MLIQPFNIKMPESGRIYQDVDVSDGVYNIKVLGEGHSGIDDGYIIGTCRLSKNLENTKAHGIYMDEYKINDEYKIIFDDLVNMRLNPQFESIFRLASIGNDFNTVDVISAEAKFVFIWVEEMNDQILRDLRLQKL